MSKQRKDKQLRRAARKKQKAQNQNARQPKEQSLDFDSIHHRLALIDSIKKHIVETDETQAILAKLKTGEALAIVTAEQTLYAPVDRQKLIEICSSLPENEVNEFLDSVPPASTPIYFQEDDHPAVMFYASNHSISRTEVILPKVGLYVSTNTEDLKFYVEDSYGEDPRDFFTVEVVEASRRDDFETAGTELAGSEWFALVEQYALVYQEELVDSDIEEEAIH